MGEIVLNEEIKFLAKCYYINGEWKFIGNESIPEDHYNINNKKVRKSALSYQDGYVTNNPDSNKYHAIVLVNGNRVGEISRDGFKPYKPRNYTERILNYFDGSDKNIYVTHILLDTDSHLAIETKMLADVIKKLSINKDIKSIHYIGHSKGGNIGWNIPKHLKKDPTREEDTDYDEDNTFEKTLIYITAPPLEGCLIASGESFIESVQEKVNSNTPWPVNMPINFGLTCMYKMMYTGKPIEIDISPVGSNPKGIYDPEFILNTFSDENLLSLTKVRYLHGFTTGFDKKPLDLGKYNNVGSHFMFLLDKKLMPEKGTTDGFVEIASQLAGHNYLIYPNTSLEGAPHFFLGSEYGLNAVLDVVKEQMVIFDKGENVEGPKLRRR